MRRPIARICIKPDLKHQIQKFLGWMKVLALPLTFAIFLISAIFYSRFRSFLKRIESEIDSSQTNRLHSNRLDQIGIEIAFCW